MEIEAVLLISSGVHSVIHPNTNGASKEVGYIRFTVNKVVRQLRHNHDGAAVQLQKTRGEEYF